MSGFFSGKIWVMGLLDLIFPKTCLGCGREGRYLCPICVDKIPRAPAICPYCQHPSIDGATHINCQRELSLDGLTSIWKYTGLIRKAIVALKYKYATEIGKEISEYTIDSFKSLVLPPVHNLIPIPVYWYKENIRGFNQSIELGGKLAENLRLKFVPDLLTKRIPTPPQTGLSRKERRKNLTGVFDVNPNYQILDSSYLLFDDVFTTGSTMFEATKALKRGGAKKVWGLTIAR
jgi:ComF family protein